MNFVLFFNVPKCRQIFRNELIAFFCEGAPSALMYKSVTDLSECTY
jgi:hypothetical protein